ncbi:hypothetical protein D3C87_15940 [compost metagenome]
MKNVTSYYLFLLSVFFLSSVFSCSIMDDPELKLLKEFNMSDRDLKIKVYLVPPNASNSCFIQIKRIWNNKEEVIENFENYNQIDNAYFIGKDSLRLFLSDVDHKNRVKIDTVVYVLKKAW